MPEPPVPAQMLSLLLAGGLVVQEAQGPVVFREAGAGPEAHVAQEGRQEAKIQVRATWINTFPHSKTW